MYPKYALLTLLKLLITTSLLYRATHVQGAALLSEPAHRRNSTNATQDTYYDYGFDEDSQELEQRNSEEIPDPSPLVVSGYNLPEAIFNRGKPFYVEKDPLTGDINFAQKSPLADAADDFYDYADEPPGADVFDKANIDRKDGDAAGHRHADVNRLTPNFHDFLNLPVKYQSAKYVYPLISSSYASTKIQGSVNKFHNHKDYNFKTSTRKPTPTYWSAGNQYFARPSTTTSSTATEEPTTHVHFTAEATSPSNAAMGHPGFQEEFEDYDATTTTEKVYLTTKETSTMKAMSLFEQLFGEYDDTVAPVGTTKAPSLFANLPGSKNKYRKTEKPQFAAGTAPAASTTTTEQVHNAHAGPNVLDMEYEEYGGKYEDNVAVQNEPVVAVDEDLTVEPLVPSSTTTSSERISAVEQNHTDYYDYPEPEMDSTTTTSTTTTVRPTTSAVAAIKVTSLPLGDNHLTTPPSREVFNRDPIIVATQNLREKLNGEKVVAKPLEMAPSPPSASNVHIAHNQDTVSFVVGNQQSVGDQSFPEAIGSHVTIQPTRQSQAALAIGHPVAGDPVRFPQPVEGDRGRFPLPVGSDRGRLPLPVEGDRGRFPLPVGGDRGRLPQPVGGATVVFPEEETRPLYDDRRDDVLALNSQPMYHQLPSDLTPPKETAAGGKPPSGNFLVPEGRPPWDPRPGHFHSGRPEYNRPPRPPPDVAYKRIDSLPNILPQFRPNMNRFYEKKLDRQPLLDRPASNRPMGFFEKLLPPPPPLYRPAGRKPVADDGVFYRTPPKVKVASRRSGEEDVATLQMIQAKNQEEPVDRGNFGAFPVDASPPAAQPEKTVYKVYPVATPPIELDSIEPSAERESVVVGTRAAEPPRPPQGFVFERRDAPVLQPHSRPLKSSFPYAMERPAEGVVEGRPVVFFNNQWNAVGESDQISATLRTVTERPIAVAYTPTEPEVDADRYSMPNYGSQVIPEIRPGDIQFQAHHAAAPGSPAIAHRSDEPAAPIDRPQLDFQAPFLASDHVDAGASQGWAAVRTTDAPPEGSTAVPYATTGDFDMERFRPHLEGGFKPLYSPPEEGKGVGEREER